MQTILRYIAAWERESEIIEWIMSVHHLCMYHSDLVSHTKAKKKTSAGTEFIWASFRGVVFCFFYLFFCCVCDGQFAKTWQHWLMITKEDKF